MDSTPEPASGRHVARLLESFRFRFDAERDLQEAISEALLSSEVIRSSGNALSREVVLGPKDRIDFLVGGLGIEVKVDGSLSDLIRQLHRYAQSPRVEELLVVTSRSRLLALPTSIGGKPVSVAFVPGDPF